MTASFDLRHVDWLTSGTVGPPGARVFYLQAAEGEQVVTLRMEKQQLAALCEHLGAMMADLPELPDLASKPSGLRQPVVEAWTVGGMGIAYEHDDDTVVLVAEELVMGEGVSGGIIPDDEPDNLADHLSADELSEGLAGVLEDILDLGSGPDSDDDDDVAFDDPFGVFGDGPDPATARLHVPRVLVPAFIDHARQLITAGRPTCDLCGNPINPGGHPCPRLN